MIKTSKARAKRLRSAAKNVRTAHIGKMPDSAMKLTPVVAPLMLTPAEKIREARYGTPYPQAEANGLPSEANPKAAFGDAKVALQLVPPAVGVYAAIAFKEGAIKYGAYNYRVTKVESMTYIGAILRHIEAYLDGEEIDPDSILGKPHLSGIIASAGILADATENGYLIDNRPPKGTATALLKKWERALSDIKKV